MRFLEGCIGTLIILGIGKQRVISLERIGQNLVSVAGGLFGENAGKRIPLGGAADGIGVRFAAQPFGALQWAVTVASDSVVHFPKETPSAPVSWSSPYHQPRKV